MTLRMHISLFGLVLLLALLCHGSGSLRAETPPQTAGDELVSVVTLIISLCHDFANVTDGERSKQLDALISSGKTTV